MAVNWNTQQFQPQTQLDLSPLNQFAVARRDRIQKSLADLTLTQEQKKARDEAEVKEIMMRSGGNPMTAIPQLKAKGYFTEAGKFEQAVEARKKAKFESDKAVFELNKQKRLRVGELARGVTTSDNPAQAFRNFQSSALDEKLPINRAMLEYQVTDEDNKLDPNLVTQLNYMGSQTGKSGTQARVRTIYANGMVWLQDKDGNIEPARDPKTGKQLSQSETYKTVAGEDEIYTVGSKSGELKGTGIKPKGRAKEKADIAKTVQETKIAGEKWLDQKDKNIAVHKKMKMKNKNAIDKFSRFSRKARAIANSPDLRLITGAGKYLPSGKETPLFATKGKDLQADLDNLVAMGAIGTMIQLKAESATGSTGFGALSQKELDVLQNALGSLDNDSVSVKKKKDILLEVAGIMDKYQDAIEGFEAEHLNSPVITNEDIDTMTEQELLRYLGE